MRFNIEMVHRNKPGTAEEIKTYRRTCNLYVITNPEPLTAEEMMQRTKARSLERTKFLALKLKDGKHLPGADNLRW